MTENDDTNLQDLFTETHYKLARHFEERIKDRKAYRQLVTSVEELVEKAYWTAKVEKEDVSGV